jgi:diketogulonate reductase-like aldo/keto reductase
MISMNKLAPSPLPMRTLPGGESIPRPGLGTWRMGEARSSRNREVAVLRHAIAAGISLIDTAEMYGEGGAEEVVGESWRGEHPLADTVSAFEELKRAGKISHWGVCNFDTADMQEFNTVTEGRNCAVNQIYYNLAKRWPEATLLP